MSVGEIIEYWNAGIMDCWIHGLLIGRKSSLARSGNKWNGELNADRLTLKAGR